MEADQKNKRKKGRKNICVYLVRIERYKQHCKITDILHLMISGNEICKILTFIIQTQYEQVNLIMYVTHNLKITDQIEYKIHLCVL